MEIQTPYFYANGDRRAQRNAIE